MESCFKEQFENWLNLANTSKKSCPYFIVDAQFISKKLLKQLVLFSKVQNQSSKQNHKQSKNDLNINETFKNSVNEISLLFITLAYNHNIQSVFKVKNIVGFYSIAQTLVHSSIIQQKFANLLNNQVIHILFSQPLHAFKQIYNKADQSKFLRAFTHSFQSLIQKRIFLFVKTFGLSHNLIQLILTYVRYFLQKENIGQSNKVGNNRDQFNIGEKMINQISIDMILLASIYLIMYKRKQKRIRFSSILQFYKKKIAFGKILFTGIKLLQFYNNFMIRYYTQKKLLNINRVDIEIDQDISYLMTCQSIENQSSVLDNYMSSLQN